MKKIGVVSEDGSVLRRKQANVSSPGWWGTASFYIIIKILSLMTATSLAIYGLVLLFKGEYKSSAVVWMTAFIFMSLVWAIEARLRSENSLYKTVD